MLNRPHAVRPCNPRIWSLQAFPILTPIGHSKHSLDLPIGLCQQTARWKRGVPSQIVLEMGDAISGISRVASQAARSIG